MKLMQRLVATAVVFAGVALGWGSGPGAARADDGCDMFWPDCYKTMGMCGAECGLCDPTGFTYDSWTCDSVCQDYGGAVDSYQSQYYNLFTRRVEYTQVCVCAWECPMYLD